MFGIQNNKSLAVESPVIPTFAPRNSSDFPLMARWGAWIRQRGTTGSSAGSNAQSRFLSQQFFDSKTVSVISEDINKTALKIVEETDTLESGHLFLRLKGDHTTDTSFMSEVVAFWGSQPEVSFLEQRRPITALNRYANWVTQSDRQDKLPLYEAGLTGEGHVLGFSDTGIDMGHCFFRNQNGEVENSTIKAQCNPYDAPEGDSRCRKVIQYWTYANQYEDYANAHGTHVGGTLAGFPPDFELGADEVPVGLAPRAKLAFFDIGGPSEELQPPSAVQSLLSRPFAAGARVHCSSWGTEANEYDLYAHAFDSFAVANQEVLLVVASGNRGELGFGSIGSPGTAKNVLTVGASINAAQSFDSNKRREYKEGNMIFFSGQGPTKDGRRKPDITAPGIFILSSASSGQLNSGDVLASALPQTCGMVKEAGTSMAAPAVAASMLLVRQYFMLGFYPTGSRSSPHGFSPSGALLKAMAIASAQPLQQIVDAYGRATDIASVGYPSNIQGYGRLQLDHVLYFTNASSTSLFVADMPWAVLKKSQISTLNNTYNAESKFDTQDNPMPSVGHGESVTFWFNVEGDPSVPFKAVLVWTDPTAAVASSHALVNDLDLEVHDGHRVYGPLGASISQIINGTEIYRDRENNVEVCILPGPTKQANYSVVVRAASVSTANRQNFALVISAHLQGAVLSKAQRYDNPNNDYFSFGHSLKLYGPFVFLFVLISIASLVLYRRRFSDQYQPPPTINIRPHHADNAPRGTIARDVGISDDNFG